MNQFGITRKIIYVLCVIALISTCCTEQQSGSRIESLGTVSVDYDKTIDQSLADAGYTYVNEYVHNPVFDFNTKVGTADLEVLIVTFDSVGSYTQVRQELDKLGLRPLTLRELIPTGPVLVRTRAAQWSGCLIAVGSGDLALDNRESQECSPLISVVYPGYALQAGMCHADTLHRYAAVRS